jgi:hypothetical protein
MDITFDCNKCGQHIAIDEAGAGITIDCPGCGKPVYVPSPATHKPSAPPTRVEVRSVAPKAPPVLTPKAASSSGQSQARSAFCGKCFQVKQTQHCCFRQNVSFLIARRQKKFSGDLCQRCMGRMFRQFTLNTVVGTWWGVIGAILGPVIILGNIFQYAKGTYRFIRTT